MSATTVFVLFHETNSGHAEDSDGYVEAVYATEALAQAARLRAIRTLVANGEDVYWNPDAPEGEQEGPSDWTDDFRVIAMPLETELSSSDPVELGCPTCHAYPGVACHGSKGQTRRPHPARLRAAARTWPACADCQQVFNADCARCVRNVLASR